MAFVGVGMAFTVAMIGLFYFLGKLKARAMKIYSAIFNAVCWNSMIRYVLQSTLKL